MNILFICTGNTCRSCMAEAIFNTLNEDNNFKAFSAGVYAVPGSKTSKNSSKVVLENLGISIEDRCAVQLSSEHLKEADLVLTMTGRMKDILKEASPEYSEKIFVLNEYVGIDGDVIDPYGGVIEIYEKTYLSLKNSINLLLAKIKKI